MSSNNLPGFEVTPARNRALVAQDTESVADPLRQCPIFHGGEPQRWDRAKTAADLTRKRVLHRFIDAEFDTNLLGNYPHVEDWDAVRGYVTGLIDEMYGGQFPDTISPHPNKSLVRIADEGVATMTALLEVGPRVMMNERLDNPNEQLAKYARRSIGLVIGWMGVHEKVDPALAFALAERKPLHITRVFDRGLRFSPRWFLFDRHTERYRLDPDRADNLRGSNHRTHPAWRGAGSAALFGCPAWEVVPQLYDEMVSVAEASGLFGETYADVRRSHGYVSSII